MDRPCPPPPCGPASDFSGSASRRVFLGGLLACGVALPRLATAQAIDPTTGQAVYGTAAAGQAPDMGLYQLDPAQDAKRNISAFRNRHWNDFYPSLGKGVILADINSRALHFWSGDESTYLVFPSSIPVSEELTKRGRTEVVRKAERPSWTPTPSMRERDPTLPQRVEGGAEDNPLGVYALYLSWPAYLIHGTHDTRKIGRKSSSGCYGLYNEHIARLYPLVEIGTQVAIF
ncbi:Lipoprotein-anchoring transpeptidase ErfK/SrfK [Paracoccus solventivorans]|uniref:Lipoprotein-anchoring transpeptidase ErfK/SrfK n=1 Tax=Paracoccus solventivorans TaxID=53463 RepID=A0A1M7FFJ7_9RHOB|nr:L,D-transpeptidase [Paracoccus solventivorans]SHM02735.1 Lipoprotein-anchoring transpeptidase ErfK/SrfK [Paracoccus solventivorans]